MTEPRAALAAIGQLVDSEIDIGNAALQLARVDAPDADWQAAARHLSDLAQGAVKRAAAMEKEDLPARATALADVLAGEFGYSGDLDTYDDLANANLIRVTERRRGLPVALGVIWLHAARAAGWGSHGVDFPAHFLVALEGHKTQVVIDVFNGGQIVSARDLRALLRKGGTAARAFAAHEHAARVASIAEQHFDATIGGRRFKGRPALHRGHAADRARPGGTLASGRHHESAAGAGGGGQGLLSAIS
jgi:regulator of sirC expression with transglutaminase-like and TPR domain